MVALKGWREIQVRLADGRACAAARPVCIADGCALSNTRSLNVPGERLSVAGGVKHARAATRPSQFPGFVRPPPDRLSYDQGRGVTTTIGGSH